MATVSKAVQDLWEDTHVRFSTVPYPNLSDETEAVRHRHADDLDAALRHDRDMDFTLFGFKTLMQSYLTKDCNGHVIERPQHLWMRVAVGIHGDDLEAVLACYEMLSTRRATHATPTLFNAGTIVPQMSSCFLLALKDDSIDGIFRTVHDCAMISKSAGGIGIHVHNVRASGAYIHGTNGTSNGIVPMVRPVLLLQQRLCVFAFSPELTHFLYRSWGAVASLQQHGALRRPRRRSAQRVVRDLAGALAPGRRGLPAAAQEHGRGGGPGAR